MFNGKNILKCRLLEILPRVLSVKNKKKKKKKKENIFLTENNYFALHSDIPYVLEKYFIITS